MSGLGVVVATHGEFGKALIASAEMIVGKQENVTSVSLAPDDNLAGCIDALKCALDQVECGASAIILIDLFGGTPSNATGMVLCERDCAVISGVSLPMLLEVLLNRDCVQSVRELTDIAVQAGHTGIVDVGEKLRQALALSRSASGASA